MQIMALGIQESTKPLSAEFFLVKHHEPWTLMVNGGDVVWNSEDCQSFCNKLQPLNVMKSVQVPWLIMATQLVVGLRCEWKNTSGRLVCFYTVYCQEMAFTVVFHIQIVVKQILHLPMYYKNWWSLLMPDVMFY